MLTYWPSEFSQVRGQYRRTNYARRADGERVPVPVPVLDRRARRASVLGDVSDSRSHEDTTWHVHGRRIACCAVVAGSSSPRRAFAQGKLNVVADDRGSRVDRARGRRRSHHRRIDRQGYQDPHFVEAKPSFILKLQKADLLIVVGRELEIGWLPPLIQQSRNAKIQAGRAPAIWTRRSARRFSRSRPGRSRARWATSIRSATRTTGSIRRTASASPRQIADKLSRAAAERPRVLRAAARRLHDAARRGREALAGA